MTWPTSDVDTTKTDQGTDDPSQARAALADLIVKFNQARNHVSAYVQGVLAAASAAAARVALGTVGMDLVATRSPAASTSESFTGLSPNTFYRCVYILEGGASSRAVRFNSDSGANYSHAVQGFNLDGTTDNASLTGDTRIDFSAISESDIHGEFFFNTKPGDATIVLVHGRQCMAGNISTFAGKYDGAADLTSMQVVATLGNMTGTISLYKLHQA